MGIRKPVLIFGLLSGSIAIAGIVATIVFDVAFQWLGYLIMLIAFTAIYVAVLRYREQVQGGVLGFSTGLKIGVLISVTASIVYMAGWELYLFVTDYRFADDYVQSVVEAQRSAGLDESALQELRSDMEVFAVAYDSFFYRAAMTLLEIFPVGLLVSVASAALLKK